MTWDPTDGRPPPSSQGGTREEVLVALAMCAFFAMVLLLAWLGGAFG